MTSRAAAKGRKVLLLAAVCLASALLLSPIAEASRSLPASAIDLTPPVPSRAAEAPPAPGLNLFHIEDELLVEILTGVEPEDHQALLEHRHAELLSPSSWTSAIQKTASGVSTSDLRLNVQKPKHLKPDLRWTVPFYAKARFYDPEVGRFLTEDPAEPDLTTPPSLHKYLYAYGNPTRYWDPLGRQSADVHDEEESDRPFFNRFFDALLKPFRSDDEGTVPVDDDEPSWLEKHFKLDVVEEAEDNLGSTLSRSRERRERRLEITDDNLESVNESGAYQVGMGDNARAIKEVVVAGSVTTLIIVDDIGLVTGAGGLAKYGFKEGAEFVVKKFGDDAIQLYRVVDGKAVRQSLDSATEKSIAQSLEEVSSSATRKGTGNSRVGTGKTPGGMPRVSQQWRNRYGPSAMREHHLVPQELLNDSKFTDRLRDLGVRDPDAFVHRKIGTIPQAQHAAVHEAGWNSEWKRWYADNLNFTLVELEAQIKTMMAEFNIPRSSRNFVRTYGNN